MRFLCIAAFALALGACGDDPARPGSDAVFAVRVSGETFAVATSDATVIALLEARLDTRREGVVLGRLARGDAGVNSPWSWHMEPETVQVADVAIELCDGRPSMVEADLDYWIDTVGAFCPWGARVVERLR